MTTVGRSRYIQYAVIAACLVLLVAQIFQAWKAGSDPSFRFSGVAPDFKTFYCAGAARNAGNDPYLEDALERCGAAPGAPLASYVRTGVWAAPIPGYDVAITRILSHAPYQIAATLWLLLSIGSLTLAVVLLAELTGLAPLAIFAAFFVPLYYLNPFWGQLPPIVAGGLAIAAFALKRESFVWAGIGCVMTLIEPHLGGPVCLAVFLFVPKTRITIATGVVALCVISVAALGVHTNIEYLRTVLPLQSIAEAPAANQYSLTWLLYYLGFPEALAVKIGSVSYVLMAAAGIYVASIVGKRLQNPAFYPIVPVAFIVFGGMYVHATQLAVALMLGVMLLPLAPRLSPLLYAGLFLLVPDWYVDTWVQHPYTLVRLESMIAVAGCAYYFARSEPIGRRVVAMIAAGAGFLVLSFMILHVPPAHVRVPLDAAAFARALGDKLQYSAGAWGVHIRSEVGVRISSLSTLAWKVPAWIGVLCLLIQTWRTVQMAGVRQELDPAVKHSA